MRGMTDKKNYKAIADKIREGNGDPESIKYLPGEMPAMIDFSYETQRYIGYSDGYGTGKEKGKQEGYDEGYTVGYGEAYGLGMDMGKYEEYNRFWDSFQNNGKRTNCRGMFAGTGWNENTFCPKYKTTPTSNTAVYMFSFFGTSNPQSLDYRNYKHLFDFSKITNAINMFQDAKLDYIDVDLSNATNLSNVFSEGYYAGVKTHITLKVSEKCTTFSSAFAYCSALTDLIFADGSVIAASIDVSKCPLTAESLVSIVEHLSDETTGKTATFKQTAIDNADWSTTEYSSWDELIATKPNWAFAYA